MTRIDQVIRHLSTGRTLTQGEATILGYGTRLAATIHDIKRKGHNVVTTIKHDINGYPYAEYKLVTRSSFTGARKAVAA